MSSVKASVIVPSYASAGTIRACLDSLLQQSPSFAFEVLLVDSGPDATAEIVAQEYPQVRLIRCTQQTGPAEARNLGASQAQGEFLAFLDSDCIAGPGWLSGLVQALQAGYDGVGGSILNGNRDSLPAWAGYCCEFREFLPLGAARPVTNLTLGNCAYRRELFWAVGGFPPGCFPQEDQVFHAAFTQQGGKLRYDPALQVTHFHRTAEQDFLEHQYRIGQANARVLDRLNLAGAFLVRRPGLGATLRPALIAVRFLRTLWACLPLEKGLVLRTSGLPPLILRGTRAWAAGLLYASRSFARSSELTHDHPRS